MMTPEERLRPGERATVDVEDDLQVEHRRHAVIRRA